ncbi:MAG: NPCBM/NEW2 domain-containing protein [Methanobacteriota archaeon]
MMDELSKPSLGVKTSLLLFMGFFLLYFFSGALLLQSQSFDISNLLFDADVPRVIDDLTLVETNHGETNKHPLFILFFNPQGLIISRFLTRKLTALFITAVFGALAVSVFSQFLRLKNVTPLYTLLFSCLLGLSWAHFLFSSMPETFMFSACSMILLLAVYASVPLGRKYFAAYLAATIFSVGITITNFTLAAMLLVSKIRRLHPLRMAVVFIVFTVIVLAVTAGLAVIQKSFYPSSVLFFDDGARNDFFGAVSADRTVYLMRYDILEEPIESLVSSLPHFFAFNVVASKTRTVNEHGGVHWTAFVTFSKTPIARKALILLYLAFAVTSLSLTVKHRFYKNDVFIILLLYFLWNFILHQFYGRDYWITTFSAHYTFPQIAILALPFTAKVLDAYSQKFKRFMKLWLILLLILLFFNNLVFLKEVYLKYGGPSLRCPLDSGAVYLSQLTPISAIQGYGILSPDETVDGNSMRINGRPFCRGLGTHSHSEIVYDLRGLGASRFVSFVGVDDEVQYGSVVFQVYGDGKLLAETRLLKKGMGPDSIIASVENVSKLKLVVTDGGDQGGYGDHADWADAKLVLAEKPSIISHIHWTVVFYFLFSGVLIVLIKRRKINSKTLVFLACIILLILLLVKFFSGCPRESGVLYLSDLTPVYAVQGWGGLSRDLSVANNSLFVNGVFFCRGLGTHSHSEIVYDLRGLGVSRFVSFVGVDDEVQYGSVVFEVYGDGKRLYESRLLKKGDGPEKVDVSVEGVSELKLVVTDGGDRGGYGDHADWADAKLVGPEYLVKAKTDMGSGNLIASRLIVLLPLIFLFNIFHTILYKLNLDGKKIIAILLLLSLLVFQCVLSMGYKNPTYDEPGHIGGGYAYIAEGEFRLGGLSSMEHPPLVRSIGAFPLLFIDGLKFSRDSVDWYKTSHWTLGNRLLYGDYEKTGPAIFFTRLAIIVLSVFLAAYVFTWATQLFGFKAGFFSLFLYVLNPNILAHSQLVTTDLGGTFFMFIAVYYLWVNSRNPSTLNLFLSNLSFGLALVSKISALMLVPVYLIMVFAYSVKESSSTKNFLKKYVSRILILIVSALLVINLAYGFQGIMRPLKSYQLLSPIGRILQVTPLNDILVPLPYAYVLGMDYGMYHSARGHPTFFLGKVMGSGSWFYYPLVFLVKNPIPLLLFLLIATIQHFRKKTNILDLLFIVIPVFVYFVILSQGNVNIGLRHALPTFPLLFVYASRIVGEIDRRILYTLCIIYIFSSLSIYPDYISYFNEFAGGADKGYRFVVVSDLDWGQDMLGLAAYVNENNITNLYYSKYNTADPGYYGLSYKPLECGEQSGVIAIHVANLLRDTECNGWLLNQTPYKKIGYSIFLYNTTG